jgi:hypothetical protein
MPGPHECIKIADIARLTEKTDRMAKIIEGNGQPGILAVVIRLSEQMDQRKISDAELNKNIESLKTAYSAVHRFQTDTEASIIAREKERADWEAKEQIRKANMRWMIRLLVASALTILGLIVSK